MSSSDCQCSGGMPMPLSRTRITASSPSRSADSQMRPPLSVNLAALFSRLPITWASRGRVGVDVDWLLAAARSSARVLETVRAVGPFRSACLMIGPDLESAGGAARSCRAYAAHVEQVVTRRDIC